MKLGLLAFALCGSALCACAPFKPSDHRAAVCNELNSRIIFNANTSNTRIAEAQQSQASFLQHAYAKNNCDQPATR